jgi:hypothetical protein
VALAATAVTALSASTVSDMNSLAIIRESDGKVVTFVRPDQPAGWKPPEGTRAIPVEQLPAGWEKVEEEAPSVTAEQWVEQHLTSTQLHALSDLRLSLVLAGKPLGPLMQSLRDWTSQLIVASAVDPSPRDNWTPAPCTYEEASSEAVQALTAQP